MSRANRVRRSLRRCIARATIASMAIGLSVAPQFGCGREFFRHWADQDVSEAVFEKSRDPRWGMDLFTIEPPALSRFADPYDVDRPPAPPDDAATAALSPAPQLPYHQLLVPAEGTGYLDKLNQGPRYEPKPPSTASEVAPLPANARSLPPPPPEPGVGPLAPTPGNSGTKPGEMTPIPLPSLPGDAPARPAGTPNSSPPQARSRPKDTGVLLTTFQAPGTAVPDATSAPSPAESGALGVIAANPSQVDPSQDRLRSPVPDLDPGGRAVNPNAPPVPRTDVSPEERRRGQAGSASFNAILTPSAIDFNEAQAAGLPANSRPFVIGPAQALQLALENNRGYQYNLEQVYVQALPVTLARFGFQPQFYAGMSPSTSPGQPGILQSGPNQFTYRTKEAIGGQNSALNYSTVAGVGKALTFGGRIVGGFANQTVFNFLSGKPSQPSVSSYLPLSFFQPFLRGGGRAVTLENLAQAERNLVYQVRLFTRYRQNMIPAILTSNQNFDVTQGTAGTDPTPGYLGVLLSLQTVDNNRYTVASYERLLTLYQAYVKGSASSGISQIQVDQVASQLQSQRGTLLQSEATYKSNMDSYKMELGLPPDLPCILDRTITSGFRDVYGNLAEWAASEDHDPEDLNDIVGALPRLDSIVIDGRELFRYNGNQLTQIYADPEKQQEILLAAERIALENRLDLMNNRAQLYDTWRQIAVTANALQGVFNVTLTNQITTPPTSSNPFGFSDQSKNFSVVIQSELPLIRVTERNNFRNALINYRRQQRLLQSIEDDIKLQVRQEVYQLIALAENYEIGKVNLLVTVRQRDSTLQNIIAPPTSIDAGANSANQATQTINLINGINGILGIQNQLLSNWVSFQTQRLLLFRDLGLLPYDEWEAFYEFFPTGTTNRGNPATGGRGPAGTGPANPPAPGRP